jgi:hypothetical protein
VSWLQVALLGCWCAMPWLASRLILSQKATWRRRQDRVRMIWAAWITSSLLLWLRFPRVFRWLRDAFDSLFEPTTSRNQRDVRVLAVYVPAGLAVLLGWYAYQVIRVCEGCMSVNFGVLWPPSACRSCERVFDSDTGRTDVELVRSAVIDLRMHLERTPTAEDVLAYLNERGEHFSRRRMKRLLSAIKRGYRLKSDKAVFDVLG